MQFLGVSATQGVAASQSSAMAAARDSFTWSGVQQALEATEFIADLRQAIKTSEAIGASLSFDL